MCPACLLYPSCSAVPTSPLHKVRLRKPRGSETEPTASACYRLSPLIRGNAKISSPAVLITLHKSRLSNLQSVNYSVHSQGGQRCPSLSVSSPSVKPSPRSPGSIPRASRKECGNHNTSRPSSRAKGGLHGRAEHSGGKDGAEGRRHKGCRGRRTSVICGAHLEQVHK